MFYQTVKKTFLLYFAKVLPQYWLIRTLVNLNKIVRRLRVRISVYVMFTNMYTNRQTQCILQQSKLTANRNQKYKETRRRYKPLIERNLQNRPCYLRYSPFGEENISVEMRVEVAIIFITKTQICNNTFEEPSISFHFLLFLLNISTFSESQFSRETKLQIFGPRYESIFVTMKSSYYIVRTKSYILTYVIWKVSPARYFWGFEFKIKSLNVLMVSC